MNIEKTFFVNGSKFSCKLNHLLLSSLVEKFLEKKNIEVKKVAVALNQTLIKKSKWEKTKIHENDRIEIVIPFAGG